MSEEIPLDHLDVSRKKPEAGAFADSFWGEKNDGFGILFQNLRNSQAAIKEFEIFLRECTSSEDSYVKQLGKITAQIQKFLVDTSLSPVWHQVLKELNERNSWAHLHFMNRLNELIKEVQSYYNDFRRKKRKIRDSELQTQHAVENFKNLKAQMMKQKENFYQISSELKKQNRLLDYNQSNSPSSTPVQHLSLIIQKLEKKCLQSEEDYKISINRYNEACNEYEQRFTESCNVFETQEKLHLRQMRIFIMNYTQLVAQLNSTRQKNFNECQQKMNNSYTSEALIEQFIFNKSNGIIRPKEVEFSNPFLNNSTSTMNSMSDLNLTTTTRLNTNRRSITTEASPLSSRLNFSGSVRSDSGVLNSNSHLSGMISSAHKIEGPDIKKRENKVFSIFEFRNRLKPRKDNYNTLSKRENLKKLNADEEKSLSISESKQFSLYPSLTETEKQDQNGSDKQHTEPAIKKMSMSMNFFDEPLNEQLNELEDKIHNRKNLNSVSDKISDSNIEKKNAPNDSEYLNNSEMNKSSFSSSVLNDSSLNEMMSSINSQVLESKNIPIKKAVNLRRNIAGSLVTATSLDDNNNFLSNSNEKKVSLDFIDNQDEENFFAEFDDINLDSIKQMKMNGKEIYKDNADMTNYFVESESDNEEDFKDGFDSIVKSNQLNKKTAITETVDVFERYDEDDSDTNNNSIVDENVEIDDSLSDGDSSSMDSDAPKRVVLKIKPISEVDGSLATSPDVLREISKNLQLKFNNNNNQKSRKPYTTYVRNNYNNSIASAENSVLSKSIADESMVSLSSGTNNSHNHNSTSPSLQSPSLWFESRSTSALGFMNSNNGHQRLDTDENLNESKNNIFYEDSMTRFNGPGQNLRKKPPPPLPPLPITVQQKYQKRLSLQNQDNSNTHGQIKSAPILINSTSKLSDNGDDISLDGSMKSCFESMESLTFKNLKLPGEDKMKF